MKKKNLKKMNIRMLLWFTLPYFLILFILITLSLAVYQAAFRSQIEQSMVYYRQSLEMSLENVEHTMETVDLLNDMLSNNASMQSVMYAEQEEHPLKELLDLKENLLSFYDTNNLLGGYVVYASKTNVAITSRRIILDPERAYENFLKYDDLSFQEWRNLTLTMSNKGEFIRAGDARPGSPEEARYCLYVKPYIHLEKGRIAGQSIFYLNAEKIMNMITSLLINEGVIVKVSDRDKVLISYGEWRNSSEDAVFFNQDSLYEKIEIDGKEYYMTSAMSTKYGLCIAAGVPKEALLEISSRHLRTLNICVGILVLLVLLVVVRTVMKNRQALLGLGEIVPGSRNMQSVHEEVIRIRNDKEELDMQVDIQRMLLRESLFRQLVNGFSGEDQQMERWLEYVGVSLGSEEVSARGVYLMMDRTNLETSNASLKGQEKRLAQVEQILAKWKPQIEYLFMEENNCLALLFFSEKEDDFTPLYEVYRTLAAEYDIFVHFYLGKRFTQLHHAKDSFSEARLMMRIDTQQEDRFLMVSNDRLAKDIFSYSSHDEEKLLGIMFSGEKDLAEEMLDKIYKANFEERHLSVHMRGFLYSRMVTTLLCIENSRLTEPELLAPKGDCNSKRFFEIYRKKVFSICDWFCEEKRQVAKKLDEQMLLYIKEHFKDSSLSLTELAGRYGRSESYVSLRIKEILGKSFSGYLEELRVNAANRLLEEEKLSIKEIAEAVGYNSASAFGRAYKRVTGITPSEYQTQQKRRRD